MVEGSVLINVTFLSVTAILVGTSGHSHGQKHGKVRNRYISTSTADSQRASSDPALDKCKFSHKDYHYNR